jgi:hypothetical protein
VISVGYALLSALTTVLVLQFTGHQPPTSAWWCVVQAVFAFVYYAGLCIGVFYMYENEPLHED